VLYPQDEPTIAADGDTHGDFQDSRDSVVVSQVKTADFLKKEIARVEVWIEQLMGQLGFQLKTMTGIDVVTAAELVAEICDIHRFPTADKLARFAGIAPITVGSGNKSRNYKSKQGNRELHDIIKNLATRQIAVTRTKKEPRNPYFHAYYEQRMTEGKTKQQAIICIMRKLVNIIYAMMKNKSAYVMPTILREQAG
jgi:transposase